MNILLTILAVIGVIVAVALIASAVAAVVTLWRGVHVAAEDRWDSTETEVLEAVELWKGDTLVLPIVPGRGSLRPAKPGETPATVEPDDAPAEDPIAVAERAGEFEWLKAYLLTSLEQRYSRPGRHRAVGLTDPHRAALSAPTQAFAALVREETGFELVAVGPREAELPVERLVWTEKAGWAQAAIDIEAVAS